MNIVDYNALAQATDTSWGRSSTPLTATHSVKFKLQGELLIATYIVVINFVSDSQRIEHKRKHDHESDSIISSVLTKVKARYKELSGHTLKAKEISSKDSLELTSLNIYNPKKQAYYRKEITFEVS